MLRYNTLVLAKHLKQKPFLYSQNTKAKAKTKTQLVTLPDGAIPIKQKLALLRTCSHLKTAYAKILSTTYYAQHKVLQD